MCPQVVNVDEQTKSFVHYSQNHLHGKAIHEAIYKGAMSGRNNQRTNQWTDRRTEEPRTNIHSYRDARTHSKANLEKKQKEGRTQHKSILVVDQLTQRPTDRLIV